MPFQPVGNVVTHFMEKTGASGILETLLMKTAITALLILLPPFFGLFFGEWQSPCFYIPAAKNANSTLL